jgi:hypothetical protein
MIRSASRSFVVFASSFCSRLRSSRRMFIFLICLRYQQDITVGCDHCHRDIVMNPSGMTNKVTAILRFQPEALIFRVSDQN